MTPSTEQKLIQLGRLFYATSIVAYGVQQLVVGDFRRVIWPELPEWIHRYSIFSLMTGIALIAAGISLSGLVAGRIINGRKVALCLGGVFLSIIIMFQLPTRFFISPNSTYHLGVWVETLKELALAGGAFVLAGSFSDDPAAEKNALIAALEKLITLGRIFFSTMLILFGYAHFLYPEFVATLVPGWIGASHFWTHFGGVALIGSGIAILLNIQTRPVALLLAVMLLFWVFIVHLPRAIAMPELDHGNEVASTFDALLFSGVAIIISITHKPASRQA